MPAQVKKYAHAMQLHQYELSPALLLTTLGAANSRSTKCLYSPGGLPQSLSSSSKEPNQCWSEMSVVDVAGRVTVSSCWQSQKVTPLGFVVLRVSQNPHMTDVAGGAVGVDSSPLLTGLTEQSDLVNLGLAFGTEQPSCI